MASITFRYMVAALCWTIIWTLLAFVGGCYLPRPFDLRTALIILLVILNVSTVAAYWLDKCCAVNDGMRVPELVLHYMTFFGSPIGALVGMFSPCCYHKVNKRPFLVVTVLLCVVNLAWPAIYFIVEGDRHLSSCFNSNE